MENKIDIVELLKGCPKGMELDCLMYDNVVKLIDVDEREEIVFPIRVVRKDGITDLFTKYGQYIDSDFAKCVIYPKGKTTWEGFQRPFKDGDVVATKNGIWIGIVKRQINCVYETYITINGEFLMYDDPRFCFERLATEEEKKKLFDAIKANGYKWNPKTKTLEKLIKPKFKVGDRVKKNKDCISGIVTDIFDDSFKVTYDGGGCSYVQFYHQCDWELVPNKFDITTLKPFDKVLVRDTKEQVWVADLFSHAINRPLGGYTFACIGHYPNQCIPYEGNKHLLGTTDNCDEYYKTW